MGNLMNYMYLLEDVPEIDSAESLCAAMAPLLKMVGVVLLAIKIFVPIILIVIGMIELAKAVGDADDVSKATKKLVQKLIIAILVFLVTTVVGLVMRLVAGGTDYITCMPCIEHPFDTSVCKG